MTKPTVTWLRRQFPKARGDRPGVDNYPGDAPINSLFGVSDGSERVE